ncbi:MAG TPA: hypothetical protein VM511_06155 [Luteolibacter sp.]|nr:hypothetical protein [Luteolibacter sp.]
MSNWRWWLLFLCLIGGAIAAPVWQPVMIYPLSFPKDRPDGPAKINPFENFTHLGTDFGLMGPGEARFESKGGPVKIRPDGEWTGIWHSLAGLAMDANRTMDPTDLTGLLGEDRLRVPARAVIFEASGKGDVRIELADVSRRPIWETKLRLVPGQQPRHRFEIQPAELGQLKFLNIIFEPGCSVEISSVGFEAQRPDIEPEEWIFQVSLGKLRRCHDAVSGLTRDRAHVPPGVFDSVASSGMHALASAAAASEGLLDREKVAAEIRRTTAVIASLPRAAGFLPHFTVRREDGSASIHPGTEFSTVDSAIALQSIRLAAVILSLPDVSAEIEKIIAGMDFDFLTSPEGFISHGIAEDGKTPLIGRWKDWGGESALVLAMETMVPNRLPQGRMDPGPRVYRGVGFIIEIQSLLYPDFDRPDPDLLAGTVWPNARRELLSRQAVYVSEQWPGSPAANAGIFGLSAGEAGMPGAGYSANGVDMPGVRWLHPHAMVMGLAQSGGQVFSDGIRRLEQAGVLFPQGLPENIEISVDLHNPMQGSLNASFEAIASYHGWRRAKGGPDVIDQACLADPLMRKGASRFYR